MAAEVFGGIDYAKFVKPLEAKLVDALEIRDTNTHTPTTDPTKVLIIECSQFDVLTVFVDNDLDQSVSVQVKANRAQSVTKAVPVGAPFPVVSAASGFKTLTPDTTGWLPYIYVELTCSVAPTKGSVTAYINKKPL